MEERLRKFAALVDAGNFTKAAQDLRVSQPALSVSIAKLERELRAPLLVHGVRPLALTPAGQTAYAAAKDLVVRTRNLHLELAQLAEQPVEVSLGMIDSVAGALLASAATLDSLGRQSAVSLVVDNSRNLLREVEAARLDVAFVVERPLASELLEEVGRTVEPLVLVGGRKLTATTQASLRSGYLPQFISYDQASTTRHLVEAALLQREITIEPAFYSTSPEVILRLVLLGKGVAALPYLSVRDLLAAGELSALTVGPKPLIIQRPIVAVKRRDTLLVATLKYALQALHEQIAQQYHEALYEGEA